MKDIDGAVYSLHMFHSSAQFIALLDLISNDMSKISGDDFAFVVICVSCFSVEYLLFSRVYTLFTILCMLQIPPPIVTVDPEHPMTTVTYSKHLEVRGIDMLVFA